MLTNIKIDKLHPHPQNPRKQLGDISELADSIKATGVLQNLTVIPIDPGNADTDYTVIIGHRRLAASKMTGLTQLPCIIAEMDDKTQIATMLLENIQRSDLTVPEQAQGFQLMIDMGETVSGIAEKTGFSKSTIHRRIKLMELDQDKLAQSVERNATLDDYEALGKIRDINTRNQVLEEIGTSNFKWKLQAAVRDEETAEKMVAILEKVGRFAIELKREDSNKYQYTKSITEADFELPEDAGVQRYYYVKQQSYVALYIEQKPTEKPQKTQVEIEREEKARQLKMLFRQAYEQRLTFAKDFKAKAKTMDTVIQKAAEMFFSEECSWNQEVFCALFDVKEKLRKHWESEDKGETYEEALPRIMENHAQIPKVALLFRGIYCSLEAPGLSCYAQRYIRNEGLEGLYEFLIQLGYAMSAEERALLDGSHELYDRGEA